MKTLNKLIFFIIFSIFMASCRHDIDIFLHQKNQRNPANETFIVDGKSFKRTDFVAELDISLAPTRYFYIPIDFSGDYDFEVDWGDGTEIKKYKKFEHDGLTLIVHHYESSINNPVVRISGVVQKFGNSSVAPPASERSITMFTKKVINMGDLDYRVLDNVFRSNALMEDFSPLKDNSYVNFNNVQSMLNAFRSSTALKNVNFNGVDLSNVITMANMFRGANSLETVSFEGMVLNNLTSMNSMFYSAIKLKSVDLRGLNLSKLTDMYAMFYDADELVTVNLENLNLSKVTTMEQMFRDCPKLESVYFFGTDLSGLITTSAMFFNAHSLKEISFKGKNLSNLTTMAKMFAYAKALDSVDFSGVIFENLTDMSEMFGYTENLTTVDFSGLDLSNVTTMFNMFLESSIESINLSEHNLSSITTMEGMFEGAINLEFADFSGAQLNKLDSTKDMFVRTHALLVVDFRDVTLDQVPSNQYEMFVNTNAGMSLFCEGMEVYVSNWSTKTCTDHLVLK